MYQCVGNMCHWGDVSQCCEDPISVRGKVSWRKKLREAAKELTGAPCPSCLVLSMLMDSCGLFPTLQDVELMELPADTPEVIPIICNGFPGHFVVRTKSVVNEHFKEQKVTTFAKATCQSNPSWKNCVYIAAVVQSLLRRHAHPCPNMHTFLPKDAHPCP